MIDVLAIKPSFRCYVSIIHFCTENRMKLAVETCMSVRIWARARIWCHECFAWLRFRGVLRGLIIIKESRYINNLTLPSLLI